MSQLFIQRMLNIRFLRNLKYLPEVKYLGGPTPLPPDLQLASQQGGSSAPKNRSKINEKSVSIFDIVFYRFLIPLGLPKPSPNHPQIDLKRLQNALYLFFMFYCFSLGFSIVLALRQVPNRCQIAFKSLFFGSWILIWILDRFWYRLGSQNASQIPPWGLPFGIKIGSKKRLKIS